MPKPSRYDATCTVARARIRGQPVDLDGGRSPLRRHHPARLHQVRALGHQRMVAAGGYRPSCAAPVATTASSPCSTNASSRWANRNPTTTSSSSWRSGSGSAPIYSEGMNDLDWVKRMFDGSDLPKVISWREFLAKGYYVVPAPAPERRAPVAFRWFYEGRKKDVPEPHPLPSRIPPRFRHGLQTRSGQFEFLCRACSPCARRRGTAADREIRPLMGRSRLRPATTLSAAIDHPASALQLPYRGRRQGQFRQ